MDEGDDLVMRLAGFMHIEPMEDLCEHLLKQALDSDARAHVEQVQESLMEFDEILEEIEDRALSMTVEDTIAQLDVLGSFFELNALKIARRARTACRALNQSAHFAALRRAQQEVEQAQQQRKHVRSSRARRECSSCGGDMVARTRRVDGQPFWGCEHFPTCRRAYNMTQQERAAFRRG